MHDSTESSSEISDALEDADTLSVDKERPNPGSPLPSLTEIDSCLTDRND